MYRKISPTLRWLPYHFYREMVRTLSGTRVKPKHVYFCICDHFEPYWNGADRSTARKRICRWVDGYPSIADSYRDSYGRRLKYSFFYPEEEYRQDDLNALASLCHAGYGEVEIHLHHDNDTPENLRKTLIDFKHRLHEQHGLLSKNDNGEIQYGFIHGNWALNNSRSDRRWCGVNNETSILMETGCYADFTMPSAPSETQTRKVNSIYFAVDRPTPKAHDWGTDAEVGKSAVGLLMVQGPLAFDWARRKLGLLPRLEHSGLLHNFPPSQERFRRWINAGVSVRGAPEHVFVKLYTHGTQEGVMKMMFDEGGWIRLFEAVQHHIDSEGVKVHFLSAREMVETIHRLMGAAPFESQHKSCGLMCC